MVAFLLLIKVSDVSANMFSDAFISNIEGFHYQMPCQGSSYHCVHRKVSLVVSIIFQIQIFHFISWPSGTAVQCMLQLVSETKHKKSLQGIAILRYLGRCLKRLRFKINTLISYSNKTHNKKMEQTWVNWDCYLTMTWSDQKISRSKARAGHFSVGHWPLAGCWGGVHSQDIVIFHRFPIAEWHKDIWVTFKSSSVDTITSSLSVDFLSPSQSHIFRVKVLLALLPTRGDSLWIWAM